MTESERVWQNFIRQRRNLVAVSAALIFIKIAQLHFDRELSIFGNHVSIGQPKAIVWTLWLVCGYWFYRYYVYFCDIGDKGYKGTVNTKLNYMARRRAIKNTERKEGKKVIREQFSSIVNNPPSFASWKPGSFTVILEGPLYDKDNKVFIKEEKLDVVLQDWEVLLLRGIAHIHVVLNTHYFTEYLLPIVLTICALLIWIFD